VPVPLVLEVLLGVVIAGAGVGTIVVLTRAHLSATTRAGAVAQAAAPPSLHTVPWVALPDTGTFPSFPPDAAPSPPIPVPPGTPPCTADAVEGRAYQGDRLSGGVVIDEVLLRNRGTSACTLDGYPGVMVLESRGFPLAKLTGSDAASADLPSVPAVAVLLEPGTPQLPPVAAGPGDNTVMGQARLQLEWAGCQATRASSLALFLPGDARQLTVDFPYATALLSACDSNAPPTMPTVARGPFMPTGVQWPPAPAYVSLSVAADTPPSVRRGSTLVYDVTLTNTSHLGYVLDPCPNYVEILGAKAAVANFQLNCSPVGDIAPGASVTFQMNLAVPVNVPLGASTLSWSLIDARVSTPDLTAPLTITG
jgi:hypothetical protein